MSNDNQEQYPDYPVFKGLQKPLEFMGLQGRYIYWAAGTVGGGLLCFLIGFIVVGFVFAIILAAVIFGAGGAFIFIRQLKGLHTKKAPKGIFILTHTFEFR